MSHRTALLIPFPTVGVKFAQIELGKLNPDNGPVSRNKVLRHLRRGDFLGHKCWRGKSYRWIISSRSLARFIVREKQKKIMDTTDVSGAK